MFKISDAINVQVLQIPTDKNGNTAIMSASLVMHDGLHQPRSLERFRLAIYKGM